MIKNQHGLNWIGNHILPDIGLLCGGSETLGKRDYQISKLKPDCDSVELLAIMYETQLIDGIDIIVN